MRELKTGIEHLAHAKERQDKAWGFLRSTVTDFKLSEPLAQDMLGIVPLIRAGFQIVALRITSVGR